MKLMEEIINTYKNTVYRIALSYTRNVSDAEDVFQDVFLIYFRKNPRFNDEEHRKAWLIRTTINRARKYTSRKQTFELHEGTLVTGDWQFKSEKQNDVFNAMTKLPENYRNALHLYYFEDFSTADTARILGLKESTLRVQLKRAREKMREILKEDYFYD
jgi:RNA polymerase sigma-70 factor (ECF subfamily)